MREQDLKDLDWLKTEAKQNNFAATANGMTKIKAYETQKEKLYVYRITREEWEKARNKNDERTPAHLIFPAGKSQL